MNFQCVKLQWLLCGLVLLVLHVHAIRLCGNELPEMLQSLCVHGYNTKLKRSSMPPAFNGIDNDAADLDLDMLLNLEAQPLMRALLGESANLLVKTRRRRYGIHDECCLKSCTLTELSYYCKPKAD